MGSLPEALLCSGNLELIGAALVLQDLAGEHDSVEVLRRLGCRKRHAAEGLLGRLAEAGGPTVSITWSGRRRSKVTISVDSPSPAESCDSATVERLNPTIQPAESCDSAGLVAESIDSTRLNHAIRPAESTDSATFPSGDSSSDLFSSSPPVKTPPEKKKTPDPEKRKTQNKKKKKSPPVPPQSLPSHAPDELSPEGRERLRAWLHDCAPPLEEQCERFEEACLSWHRAKGTHYVDWAEVVIIWIRKEINQRRARDGHPPLLSRAESRRVRAEIARIKAEGRDSQLRLA